MIYNAEHYPDPTADEAIRHAHASPRVVTFTIDHKINPKQEGLNAIYAGVHWATRKRVAEDWHWIVRQAMQKAGVRREPFRKPVSVTIRVNSGMDCDNHGLLLKLIVDGMKGYLIEDDTKKYVRRTAIELYRGDGIQVRVEEINVCGDRRAGEG